MTVGQDGIENIPTNVIIASLRKRGYVFFKWELNEIHDEINNALFSEKRLNPLNFKLNYTDWRFLTKSNIEKMIDLFMTNTIDGHFDLYHHLKTHVQDDFVKNGLDDKIASAIRAILPKPRLGRNAVAHDDYDELEHFENETLIREIRHRDILAISWSYGEILDYVDTLNLEKYCIPKEAYKNLNKVQIFTAVGRVFSDYSKRREQDHDFTDFMFNNIQAPLLIKKGRRFIPKLIREVIVEIDDLNNSPNRIDEDDLSPCM
jgi:hypothetical protein